MNYIKIDRKSIEGYVYLIELNDKNIAERGVIIDIDKDVQIVNKQVWGQKSGDLWRWLEDKGLKFNNDEVEKYKISEEEFGKYWAW